MDTTTALQWVREKHSIPFMLKVEMEGVDPLTASALRLLDCAVDEYPTVAGVRLRYDEMVRRLNECDLQARVAQDEEATSMISQLRVRAWCSAVHLESYGRLLKLAADGMLEPHLVVLADGGQHALRNQNDLVAYAGQCAASRGLAHYRGNVYTRIRGALWLRYASVGEFLWECCDANHAAHWSQCANGNAKLARALEHDPLFPELELERTHAFASALNCLVDLNGGELVALEEHEHSVNYEMLAASLHGDAEADVSAWLQRFPLHGPHGYLWQCFHSILQVQQSALPIFIVPHHSSAAEVALEILRSPFERTHIAYLIDATVKQLQRAIDESPPALLILESPKDCIALHDLLQSRHCIVILRKEKPLRCLPRSKTAHILRFNQTPVSLPLEVPSLALFLSTFALTMTPPKQTPTLDMYLVHGKS